MKSKWSWLSTWDKYLRGSDDRRLGKRAIYMMSAWETENELVLGQRKVDEKSYEISAAPELLKILVPQLIKLQGKE